MRADPVLVRRILGLGSAVLLVALGAVILQARFDTPGAYEVEAELGRAGTGLRSGSDVKVRGVRVGQVSRVRISDDGEVTATLELHPEPRLPRDVRPVVTPKTFLGEKQVELRTDETLTAPFLAAGDRLAVRPGDEPVEPTAVVDRLGRLVRDVDEGELAAFVDALAAFDAQDADRFAAGIDTGAELAGFLDETAPDQLARLGEAARALDALAASSADLTRLARALPDGVAPVVDNRRQLTATLERIGDFSDTLGTFLRVEEPTIGALLRVGDRVGEVVDPRLHEIGSMVHGIYRYSLMFGHHGGSLDDGTEFAFFRAFLGEAGQVRELCEQLPAEVNELAPACRVEVAS